MRASSTRTAVLLGSRMRALLKDSMALARLPAWKWVSPSVMKELTVRVGVGVGTKGGQISPLA